MLSVAFSSETRRVAAGAADKHVIVWSSEDGGAPLFHWFDSGPVHAMAFSVDGELSSGGSGDMSLWNEALARSSSRKVEPPPDLTIARYVLAVFASGQFSPPTTLAQARHPRPP